MVEDDSTGVPLGLKTRKNLASRSDSKNWYRQILKSRCTSPIAASPSSSSGQIYHEAIRSSWVAADDDTYSHLNTGSSAKISSRKASQPPRPPGSPTYGEISSHQLTSVGITKDTGYLTPTDWLGQSSSGESGNELLASGSTGKAEGQVSGNNDYLVPVLSKEEQSKESKKESKTGPTAKVGERGRSQSVRHDKTESNARTGMVRSLSVQDDPYASIVETSDRDRHMSLTVPGSGAGGKDRHQRSRSLSVSPTISEQICIEDAPVIQDVHV